MEFEERLLNHESIFSHNELFDGVQYFCMTDNYDGFSIVKHSYSRGGGKGLYEVAPIIIIENGFDIVGEPTGYLTIDEVIKILEG